MGAKTYHYPLGPAADAAMTRLFDDLTDGAEVAPRTLTVKGRTVTIPKAAGGVAWASFDELCGQPLGAADYLAMQDLERDFEASEGYKPNKADWLGGVWSGLTTATQDDRRGTTAVGTKELQAVGKALTSYPADFNINSKIKRQLKAKQRMFETGQDFDWATAEAMKLTLA